MTAVPPAKHGVQCRYCSDAARQYVTDTDGCKSPCCAFHAKHRVYLVNHLQAGSREADERTPR